MSQPATKSPIASKKPVVAKLKQKAEAFVNWSILDPKTGAVVLSSSRGFTLFLNEHCTLEERALLEIAQMNGGSATVSAELRIIVAKEKPTSIDVSKIKLAPARK